MMVVALAEQMDRQTLMVKPIIIPDLGTDNLPIALLKLFAGWRKPAANQRTVNEQ